MADDVKDLGNLIGGRLREQEDMRRSSTHPNNVNTVYLFPTETVGDLQDWMLVVKTKDTSEIMIFHDGTGSRTEVFSDTITPSWQVFTAEETLTNATKVEVVRRLWYYDTKDRLESGTNSANVTLNNNDIRLNV